MRRSTVRNHINTRRILERDGYVCVYCLGEAVVVDHITPWSWTHDDSDDNLISSCELCNSIAHDKIFESLADKYRYIKSVRDRRKKPEKWLKISTCITCHKTYKPRINGSTAFLCSECVKLDVGEQPEPSQ